MKSKSGGRFDSFGLVIRKVHVWTKIDASEEVIDTREIVRENARLIYESGKTFKEVAAEIGKGKSVIAKWALEGGWTRGRHGRGLNDPDLVAKAISLYVNDKQRVTDIAKALSVTQTTVRNWINDAGVVRKKLP